jgi:hypothetical protein
MTMFFLLAAAQAVQIGRLDIQYYAAQPSDGTGILITVSDCGTLGCIGNSSASVEVDGTDVGPGGGISFSSGQKIIVACSALSLWSDPHFATETVDSVESWSHQTSFFLEVKSPIPVKGTTDHDLRMKIGRGCFTRIDTGAWWNEDLADTWIALGGPELSYMPINESTYAWIHPNVPRAPDRGHLNVSYMKDVYPPMLLFGAPYTSRSQWPYFGTVDQQLTLWFSEPVQIGTGDVTLEALTPDDTVDSDSSIAADISAYDPKFSPDEMEVTLSLSTARGAPLTRNRQYRVMIAGGAILDKSGNSWVGIDLAQKRMFASCKLDCVPTFVVPHPGPISTAPQDDLALTDGSVLSVRPATKEDTGILLEFATESEGEAVRTNNPPYELPGGPTWAAISFEYYLTRNPDAFEVNREAQLSENNQGGILNPVLTSGNNFIPIGVENEDTDAQEATAKSFYFIPLTGINHRTDDSGTDPGYNGLVGMTLYRTRIPRGIFKFVDTFYVHTLVDTIPLGLGRPSVLRFSFKDVTNPLKSDVISDGEYWKGSSGPIQLGAEEVKLTLVMSARVELGDGNFVFTPEDFADKAPVLRVGGAAGSPPASAQQEHSRTK